MAHWCTAPKCGDHHLGHFFRGVGNFQHGLYPIFVGIPYPLFLFLSYFWGLQKTWFVCVAFFLMEMCYVIFLTAFFLANYVVKSDETMKTHTLK